MPTTMKRFLISVDGFYADPNAVRRRALAMPYSHPEHVTGWRTRCDQPLRWAMFLIYLTPGAPYDAGTSLWQHRKTGLTSRPTGRDAARLGTTVDELARILERDSRTKSRWVEIDRVGNVFNRAVMFP